MSRTLIASLIIVLAVFAVSCQKESIETSAPESIDDSTPSSISNSDSVSGSDIAVQPHIPAVDQDPSPCKEYISQFGDLQTLFLKAYHDYPLSYDSEFFAYLLTVETGSILDDTLSISGKQDGAADCNRGIIVGKNKDNVYCRGSRTVQIDGHEESYDIEVVVRPSGEQKFARPYPFYIFPARIVSMSCI